jgi:hypothetical protein
MGYGAKKKRYIVLIHSYSYVNKRTECLRLELFDTIEEAREFKKKAEELPFITHIDKKYNFETSVEILEIESTSSKTALESLRKEFPKFNLTLAF